MKYFDLFTHAVLKVCHHCVQHISIEMRRRSFLPAMSMSSHLSIHASDITPLINFTALFWFAIIVIDLYTLTH